VVVAGAVSDTNGADSRHRPVVVPCSIQAVFRVFQRRSDVLSVVGKGAINDREIRAGAVGSKGVGAPHLGAEGISSVSVQRLVPPGHGTGLAALIAQHLLVGIDVPAVPGKELCL
jgi:hypothetical protein